jgi:hypothetical protein
MRANVPNRFYFSLLRILYFRNWAVSEEDITRLTGVQADSPQFQELKRRTEVCVKRLRQNVFGVAFLAFVERKVAAFNRATGIPDYDPGKPSHDDDIQLIVRGDDDNAGGHNTDNSRYRCLGRFGQISYWLDPGQLSGQALIDTFSRLGQVNVIRIVHHDASWASRLRQMLAVACLFAWLWQVDQFGPLPAQEWAVSVAARRRWFYKALREIPHRFPRPGLETIPLR